MRLVIILLTLAVSPAMGWWCEGHEVVALIAERHLNPDTLAAVDKLLKDNPTDIPRFCKDTQLDPLALASTWADDAKTTENTAFWHYMDIPRGLKKGDPEAWCDPIGPSNNGGQRPGCVLSALRYAVNVLHSKDEGPSEKATALRYLIHLVGDLHQPLHTTSNNDRGGNCTPVQFFDEPKISNLHSIWDGMIINRDMAARKETIPQFAADLDQRYLTGRAAWIKNVPQFDKWAWESHVIADKVVYPDLTPDPPVEKLDPKADCKTVADGFDALHIHAAGDYQKAVEPVVEEQLAKAGYRLAAILNLLFAS
jgi:hypothetical protein